MWVPSFFRRRKKINQGREIAPEEIFLDSHNLPQFDEGQFEGRLEKTISKKSIYFLGAVFVIVVFVFLFRLGYLEILHGEKYRALAESNRLSSSVIFSTRGVVFDRNGEKLVWNAETPGVPYDIRKYTETPGFSHLLGYVGYPQADNKGNFYRTEYQGKTGVEKVFNKTLSGENGSKIIEKNALQKIVSKNVVVPPAPGKDLTLSIDARVQAKLNERMRALADRVGFHGGAGIIMNVHTGGILAMTSFPDYSSEVMVEGTDAKKIAGYNSNPNAPFLYRPVDGLYAPGSIVKPFVALGALDEGIATANTTIVSKGYIKIPNKYNPGHPYIFPDWKALGKLNLEQAIAHSSDVYFYELGGGYKDQKGLGIAGLNKYYKMFGLGATATGIGFSESLGNIPSPAWKRKNFPKNPDWQLGDTYHTAIGQYGMLVTPLQMVRADAAIANGGKLLTPSVIKHDPDYQPPYKKIPIPEKYFKTVRDGMRLGAEVGTAKGLDMSRIHIAAKTGTAELGPAKKWVNSWVMGFYPYENPKYAFVVVMEKGPYHNLLGGVYVMRQLFEWMLENTPEYTDFGKS